MPIPYYQQSQEKLTALRASDEILWESRPLRRLRPYLFKNDPKRDKNALFLLLLAVFLACFAFGKFKHYSGEQMSDLFVFVGFITSVLMFVHVYDYYVKSNTKFTVSKSRVYIQRVNRYGMFIQVIDWSDISEIRCNVYKDHSGVLFFILKPSFYKNGQRYIATEKHSGPTFDELPDIVALQQKLEQIRSIKP